MRKPDCETVNRVRVARIPARDRVICVNFSSIPKTYVKLNTYKECSSFHCFNVNFDPTLKKFHDRNDTNVLTNAKLLNVRGGDTVYIVDSKTLATL